MKFISHPCDRQIQPRVHSGLNIKKKSKIVIKIIILVIHLILKKLFKIFLESLFYFIRGSENIFQGLFQNVVFIKT